MAPVPRAEEGLLVKRFFGSTFNNCSFGNCNSAWNNWGRWVLLGCLVLFALLIFVGLTCFRNRRRVRAGQAPTRYTGWFTPGVNPPPAYPNGATAQQQQYQPSGLGAQQQGYYGAPQQQYTGQQQYGGYQYAPPRDAPQEYEMNNTGGNNKFGPPAYPPPAQTKVV